MSARAGRDRGACPKLRSSMASVISQLRLIHCAAFPGRMMRACAVLSALFCGVLASSPAVLAGNGEGVSAPSLPIASAVQVEDMPGVSRLVFELSGPVEAGAFVMAEPNRVIVDLPEVNFELDPRAGAPGKKGVR